MTQIENKQIETICEAIDKNIQLLSTSNPELLSQNIIVQLRHLVEHVAVKIYSDNQDTDYEPIKGAIKKLRVDGKNHWLRKFHNWTQESVSHYSPSGEDAYRLMIKYYPRLLKIKKLLWDEYQLKVLNNLNQFPIIEDANLQVYYEKIVEKINSPDSNREQSNYNDRYYIHSTKPFFINENIYYQISFTAAFGNISKFERIIAFSKLDIPSNYAVKFKITINEIEILTGIKMPIQIIEGYDISIRPCEIDNFAKIFNIDTKNKAAGERKRLMEYLTDTEMSLVDLMDIADNDYQEARKNIIRNYKSVVFSVLDRCRELIQNKIDGSNIIRYLLFRMKNRIIKQQYEEGYGALSSLYLKNGCIPFEQMPFCSSLIRHNPRISNLFECLDNTDREHEHLARIIKTNTEVNGKLYTPENELATFKNIDDLIERYHGKLYPKHRPKRDLIREKKHIYLKEYEKNILEILELLKNFTNDGLPNYENLALTYLKDNPSEIDCKEKKKIFKKAFIKSKVIALYGSAGTGKTKFIEHLSAFFKNENKYFLANTKVAVDNLRKRISVNNSVFQTVKKYTYKPPDVPPYLLIIDECSTISNADMKKILEKNTPQLLVLVGDIFQIESIQFGNWFSFAKKSLPKCSIVELNTPYRTNDTKLLELWDKVREGCDSIAEHIEKNRYSSNLNEKLFQADLDYEEKIILCLNYGGLYGVNNINTLLQANNPQPVKQWGINTYKVNDPILFNESKRFNPHIYNSCKGIIKNIKIKKKEIIFDIALDITIDKRAHSINNFELLKSLPEEGSTIRFSVNKYKSTDDDDDDDSSNHVPFHVAYAVSIHKAQGLEYDSVKVVIADEAEEQITHNIFYTAITRAKKELKIYWTAGTQEKILKRIKPIDNQKDWHLLKQKIKTK